ncbi:hypothetical protein ACRALDRAFT_2116551 [Sodiomyces alcalophilus JCM 7366]|uniref:uncharacterized protein n=1 Tax=Sodiomyces alcalophilus JCM 7366 TaxID=591952 RepID=UPI0039B3B1A2
MRAIHHHQQQDDGQVTREAPSPTDSEVRDAIEARHDLEHGGGRADDHEKAEEGDETSGDTNLVTWKEPFDPENPKQWSRRRKWAAVFCVSCFTFLSPVTSSMVAPALPDIGRDLNIPGSLEQALTMSIFVLAYAIGPLLFGPLSEVYGRIIILQLANVIFVAFNLGCGFCRTKAQMIAFRFLAGMGGSAPLAIGGGVLGDLFTPEERGRAMSIYTLTPLLGPAVGPIAGGFIAQETTWRWIFYSTTMLGAAVQVAGYFVLQETYAPVLLGRRKERLIRETGNTALRTKFDGPEEETRTVMVVATALTRPFRLLATQPIVQFLSLYMMYLYGIMYLVLSNFPALWTGVYGQPVGLAGLHYIALGVGLFLGAQLTAPAQDRVYAALKRRHGGVGRPEFRAPTMAPGAVLVPAGLLVYGWTAQARTHWAGPDVGAGVFAAGLVVGFQCVQGFLVDAYPRYAASAVGAATVLRSLAGFGFPLFAPTMYDRLGYGWGNTLLALLGVVIGWPGPVLLWRYGEALRRKSPFAAGGGG